MKKFYTYVISITAVFVLLLSQRLFAQSVVTVISNGQIEDCAEIIPNRSNEEKSVNTIIEEDYPYLKSVDCLTNGYISDARNLDLKLRNMSRWDNSYYTLTGNGAEIDIEATYDHEGNLVEATMVKKDTQIPVPILKYIYADEEFYGWTMVTNEKIVHDFDPYQTEYKVTLTNGFEEQILHFREQGEMIALVD